MRRTRFTFLVIAWSLALAVCGPRAQSQYDWRLPAAVPAPAIPADNPMSAEKVELGRYLFYDVRLSHNGTQSCASCHRQERAFTDGLGQSIGSTGQTHPRGSMSLANVAFASVLTWEDPTLTRLEDQALVPMYGDHPVELGLERSDDWLVMFRRDPVYIDLFKAAFPGVPDPISRDNLVKAIASFERSIVSARSPYDRYRFGGDRTAVSPAAKRGEALFQSRSLGCSSCHAGFNFSGIVAAKFKAPTLRNIAVTAPYMHDGSIARLEDAIAHRRAAPQMTDAGNGIEPRTLTAAQRRDLVAFLDALTDKQLILDERYGNPWRKLVPGAFVAW